MSDEEGLFPESEDFAEKDIPRGTNCLEITLKRKGRINSRATIWELDPRSRGIARRILEVEMNLDQVGPSRWLDPNTGVVWNTNEALRSFGGDSKLLRREILASADGVPAEVELIDSFLESIPTKLVETQRLLNVDDSPSRTKRAVSHRRPTVAEYADDLARIISSKLAENSRISSQLDRTFPKRVLEATEKTQLSSEELIRRYEEQSRLRDRLAEVSLAGPEQDISISIGSRKLDETERRLLSIYLGDTAKKLEIFQDLLEKLTLLRGIINDRFLFKELRIDPQRGLVFVTDRGEIVGPGQLSSGEQHEIVLLYALLFRTDPGSVVLIDEPEISLHVKWQRSFLDDLDSISKLVDLRFVIATHSPQIIDKWHSKTVQLAPGLSD